MDADSLTAEINNLPEKNVTNLTDDESVNDSLEDDLTSKENGTKIEEKPNLDPVEEVAPSKTLNVREVHETSPFKQAVKGFVLNKLSKKVGTSHILSGLTEKIVKKLEDSKDNVQPGIVHTSESELNLTSLRSKEASLEGLSTSISCELQSVVANDTTLADVLNVEDAVECLEEFSSSMNGGGISIPYKLSLRSSSISLPSSPAHRIEKRAASISGSLENIETSKRDHHPSNLCLTEEQETKEIPLLKKSSPIEVEEKEIELESPSRKNCTNSDEIFPQNAYSSIKSEKPAFQRNVLRRILSMFFIFKNILSSLSITHLLLMASLLIHNIDIMPPYVTLAFDGLVIAYIVYSYICILVQKPFPNPTLNFPFIDPNLENASIQVQKAKNLIKGSVKILKGDYDPEMVKNHPTDLIDINIENHRLTIFLPKKKTKDSSPKTESISYNLSGAVVSLVPKGVSRRSVWNKKYPICIVLPESAVNLDASNSSNVSEYLSDPTCDDNTEKMNKKALYLFTLTDREKETFFWILSDSTENKVDDAKGNEQQTCDNASKVDLSCMSYASLLESNNEESFYLKDVSEEDSLSTFVTENPSLEFAKYMKSLFETFERMNKFSVRSRSFEDLSNSKDFPKPRESFLSKDDSFLSTSNFEYAVDWLNLAVGRVFYDFLTQKCWSDYVKGKIQKKLDRIEMPAFIESLVVSDVFLGTTLPQIHNISNPVADTNGVWFNLDFNYCGTFQMTLQTKLKISKAKQLPGAECADSTENKSSGIPSSESSDEEGREAKYGNTRKKKFMNRIEKWITHKHFQTVAQNRFVKKYVGDLSNMPLTLAVELNTLHGILTINIPPAPTDRIWYGFRKDPVLLLNAYPRVGTHEINLSAVVKTIEKKLVQEFKKALVMPNMDDLMIPIMHSPVYDM